MRVRAMMGAEAQGESEAPRDLVARLRGGDRAALAETYELYNHELRRFARRLVGHESNAEDLVHDVFVALPQAIRRFERRGSLRSFLLSIAVNHCRHHLRSARRRQMLIERFGREPQTEASPSPDAQLADALERGLRELPLDQKAAFVLCALEENSSIEAAVILEIPETTVRTRVFRAKQRLRDYLEKEGLA